MKKSLLSFVVTAAFTKNQGGKERRQRNRQGNEAQEDHEEKDNVLFNGRRRDETITGRDAKSHQQSNYTAKEIGKPLELDRLHQALMRLTEGKMA